MKFKKLTVNETLPDYEDIIGLYNRAFPENERIPLNILFSLTKKEGVDFLAYYDEEKFCGLTFSLSNKDSVFILYLAVNDKIRYKGYGTAIIQDIKNIAKERSISLNVEPVLEDCKNLEERKRRIEFYRKNGIYYTGYTIILETEQYWILSSQSPFSVEEYKNLLKKMSDDNKPLRVEKI